MELTREERLELIIAALITGEEVFAGDSGLLDARETDEVYHECLRTFKKISSEYPVEFIGGDGEGSFTWRTPVGVVEVTAPSFWKFRIQTIKQITE